jgi:hypothetical protein
MESPTRDHLPPRFTRGPVDEEVYLRVLRDVAGVIRAQGVEALLIGGIGSAVFGRPRWSEDIDLFVRAQDAGPLLEALGANGFDTDETFADWLYKAFREGVVVDVIFKSRGDIYLDTEMWEYGREESFHDLRVRVAAPEDLLVMKTIAHSEPTPGYWHDALSILSRADLDWDYLLWRARAGPRRVLSLLLYAQSNDLPVPDAPVERLYRSIFQGEPLPNAAPGAPAVRGDDER